jgi:hypothetical protein
VNRVIRRTRPLEDVARLTGSSVEQLREWCATGLLSCDRVDGHWALPEAELPAAYSPAAVGPRLATEKLPSGAHLLAVAFPDHATASKALDAIRSETGVRPREVELAPLSIDGLPMVLVAGRIPAEFRARIEGIVRGAGGRVIDGAPQPMDLTTDEDMDQLESYGA